MRILIVSDFYPPRHLGGYEVACFTAAEQLRARGHEVEVLTSTHGLDAPATEGNVRRWLKACLDWPPASRIALFAEVLRKETTNQAALRRAVREFGPDLLYLWNLSHVSVSIAFIAESEGMKVCYRGTYWHEWDNDAWWGLWNRRSVSSLRQILKWPLRLLCGSRTFIPHGELKLEHIHFALEIQKRIALLPDQPVTRSVDHGRVAGPLFSIEDFPLGPCRFPPLRLLFLGGIAARKGPDTAIRALGRLPEEITLTVVGGTPDPAYAEELRSLSADLGVEDRIEWRGALPHDEIAPIYREHDIFLFPSHWETLGYVLAEAMASGAVVVGTAMGGSAELMRHGENALVFEPGDAEQCARLVMRLIEDEALYLRLRKNAREYIERDFSLKNTIDRIEEHLYEAAGMTAGEDRC